MATQIESPNSPLKNGTSIDSDAHGRGEDAMNALRRAKDVARDKIERAAGYVKERRFDGMAEDVTDMVRRNPVQSVLLSVGVGYLIGRLRRR